jgi:serine/threonine protein kinase
MSKNKNQSLENSTLAKYQVIKEIGKGNMGKVYLGHDPFVDRPVAIKVADQERLASADDGELYKKLFFNEAQAAGMLKHPNITGIFDAGVTDGVYYIVMEYVHGGETLEHYCDPVKLLPLNEVITIIYKCAAALDYAHKKGVIHRDIKPRNILITENHDIKITDFGIAVLPENLDSTMVNHAGSPLYMSPEQIRDEEITPQTDIFALGIVVYELLTGHHPFQSNNIEAIQHLILNGSIPPIKNHRSDVPDVLERIVHRALAREPRQRYKTAIDMAGDLSLVFDFIQPARESITRQEKFNAVRAQDFFRDFTDNEIWELINASQWMELPPKNTIIIEGDVDKSFYVILSGAVDVVKTGVHVDTLVNGDCFGEMGFVSGRQRTASITTREASTLMKVHSAQIERTSLNCQLRFHKLFLHTLIDRLSRVTDRVVRTGQPAAAHEPAHAS